MRRDRAKRAKRRFTCLFRVNGQSYRGITLNLSRTGLFVQTDTTVPPGSRIELELMGAGLAPDVRVSGVVARRRAVPQTLATVIRRGIGVRITEAPVEYGLMFQDERLAAPIRSTVVEGSSPGRSLVVGSDTKTEGETPADADSQPLDPESGLAAPAAATPVARPEPPPPRPPERDLDRPDVLLMDDGTLDDLYSLLREIGVDGLRIRTSRGSSPHAWIRPRRLLITSAPLALSFPWPMSCEEDGFVGIAVADDRSQTLSSKMARLGFRYLVRRPIHPQALRILLRQVLYNGSEKRRNPRYAFDAEVAWRTGVRRHPGRLVEISMESCLIVTDCTALRRHTALKITLPASAIGGHTLTLKGRVVRAARIELPDGGLGQAVAVGFWGLSSRVRTRLAALLQRCAEGHLQPPRAPHLPQDSPTPGGGPAAASPTTVDRPEEADALFAPEKCFHEDEPEKDEGSVLGSELSITGMRVREGSQLCPGQLYAVEIYEGSYHEPMVLNAEVCAEDDEEGFLLRFVAPTARDGERIAGAMKGPPAVQSLGEVGRRVVPGRMRRTRG